jgi:lysozyme
MTIPQAALDLIRQSESLRLSAYDDKTGNPVPVGGTAQGTLTIGYGHTGPDVYPDQTITPDEAEALFQSDVAARVAQVARIVHVPLTDGQMGALVSFVYNLGIGTLMRSTLLVLLNAGNYAGAAGQFILYDHWDGQENAGLKARRLAETAMFAGAVSC